MIGETWEHSDNKGGQWEKVEWESARSEAPCKQGEGQQELMAIG